MMKSMPTKNQIVRKEIRIKFSGNWIETSLLIVISIHVKMHVEILKINIVPEIILK